MADVQDTIVAIATPPGRGAIGVVRLSGPDSLVIAESICGVSLKARTAQYVTLKRADGEHIDRGIALYFQAPASFTGEEVVEMQGHGGPVVLNMILKRTLELGARQAKPGEFTERAYLNEKLDLIQAEAVADLIDSSSEAAVRSAIRSLDGEFSADIHSLVAELVGIRAYVEGALDFPEEEIDFLNDSEIGSRITAWQKTLEELLSRAKHGKVLREGLRVVILGRPNVGKSSLLNRLSQTDKAIITPTPGTTRDLIEDRVLIGGVPIDIVDTAGIREAGDDVEQEGIRRAKHASETADLVLLVTETGFTMNEGLDDLLDKLDEKQSKILVVNKIDLAQKAPEKERKVKDLRTIYLSAKTGEGLDALREAIKAVAGIEQHGEGTVLARIRHVSALEQSGDCVLKGLREYTDNKAPELLAEELTRAQQFLGTITGELSADEFLGEIFSSFCIGK